MSVVTTPVVVSGKAILSLLQNGYVRYKKDRVEGSVGSVEEELNITAIQLKEYLKHPKLKNFRYVVPNPTFIDDFDAEAPVMVSPRSNVTTFVDDFASESAAPIVEEVAEVSAEEVLENIADDAELIEAELFS